MKFTADEERLIEYAKLKVLEYSKLRKSKGLYDTIYAFVLSNAGNFYDGVPLELPSGVGFCAERHAIANMLLKETEKAKIKSILVASPVPAHLNKPSTPCGACRLAINEFGTNKTTILCAEFIRRENAWEIFPKIWKCKIKDLYPLPWKDPWNEK